MKVAAVSTILGYTMSVLMGAIGILVLSGILMTEKVTPQLRIMFGVVLLLYSVYRFMATRTRNRRQEEGSDE